LNKAFIRTAVIALVICAFCWWFFKDRYHRYVWNDEVIPNEANFVLSGNIPELKWELIGEYPHARESFTQGLLYDNGKLYEGTGNYGYSKLTVGRLENGAVYHQQKLDPSYFGEGITLKGDSLLYLTWKEGKALIFQKDSLAKIDEISYEGEGWGLAWDEREKHFLMTDGSSLLQKRQATDFSIKESVAIHDNLGELSKLNELELVNDTLWANVWGSDYALAVNPADGKILAAVNFRALKYQMKGRAFANVLNGIAYKPETDTFLITGKNWTRIFEVKIIR
jgi:glutaminyl-peptide cyclotransferase